MSIPTPKLHSTKPIQKRSSSTHKPLPSLIHREADCDDDSDNDIDMPSLLHRDQDYDSDSDDEEEISQIIKTIPRPPSKVPTRPRSIKPPYISQPLSTRDTTTTDSPQSNVANLIPQDDVAPHLPETSTISNSTGY